LSGISWPGWPPPRLTLKIESNLNPGDLKMEVKCPPKIFEEFQAACGDWIYPDDKGFLYKALGEGLDFPGVVSLEIPELDDKAFDDWTLFEYWCDDIRNDLMYKLIEIEVDEDFDKEERSPREWFKSKKAVKEKIIAVICSDEYESADVMCVEIESEEQRLFLIYKDADAWALGHGEGVLVVKSLDELTPELGFYDA
jgi:hypothetical protein